MNNEVPGKTGNDHPTMAPMGTYPTIDGYINIASAGDEMWQRLCETLNIKQYFLDNDFKDDDSRTKNRKKLNKIIIKALEKGTSKEWISKLNKASIPCGPINNIKEVFADPQVVHNKIAQSVKHDKLGNIKLVGQPVKLSRTPSKLNSAAPEKGQHTEEILKELGYENESIKQLKLRNII